MGDTITVTGNIATEPDFKRTPAGVAITSFRLASSQRRFDRTTGTWIDGGTNFYTVSMYRGLAEHAFTSFTKGDRVLLTGRLRIRDWDTGTSRGTSAEIDAEAIGHDLLWGTTTFVRAAAKDVAKSEPSRDDDWSARSTEAASGEPDQRTEAWAVPGGETSAERARVAAGAGTPF